MSSGGDEFECGPEHKRNPSKHRRTYSQGQYGPLTKQEIYRVEVYRRLNDDYSVQLPLKKQLTKGFADEACDYAASKQIQQKRNATDSQRQIQMYEDLITKCRDKINNPSKVQDDEADGDRDSQ